MNSNQASSNYHQDNSSRRTLRWRISTALLLTVGYGAFYICRANLSIIGTIDEFHGPEGILDSEGFGLLGTVGLIAYAIGKFFNGSLTDFLGGRLIFLGGMALSILATIAFGLSSGTILFALIWLINRFVQSGGWAALMKIAAHWFPYQWHGSVMGFISISYLLGDAITRGYLGYFRQLGFDWRIIMFISAGTFFLMMLPMVFLLKEKPGDLNLPEPEANPENVYGKEGEADHPESVASLMLPLLKSVSFWMVLTMSFGLTFIREMFNFWSAFLIKDVSSGISDADAIYGSMAFPFGGFISVLLAGFLSDKLANGNRAKIILPGLILSCVAIGGLFYARELQSFNLLVFGIFLVAFFLIGPYSFLGAVIALDLGGKRGPASASGIIDGVGYLGAALSGWGVGVLLKQFDSWTPIFALLAVAIVLSTVAASLYWWRTALKEKRLGSA